MPIKVILAESALDIAHDLQQWNSPLRQAIAPGMGAYSYGQPALCWLYESVEFLTDSGIRPRHALTTVFTNRPENSFLPSPVSAALMRRSQKKFEDIVATASSLTGHQKLQLREEIIEATNNPVPTTHLIPRGIADAPESWRQVARGDALTRLLVGELKCFDTALDVYDPTIGAKPVLGVVGALGRQAGLAKHINDRGIQPDDWPSISRFLATCDAAFEQAREQCERLIEAHTVAFERVLFLKPNRSGCVSASLAKDIHDILFREMLPDEQLGFFRRHSAGVDFDTGLPGLPHGAIREQMRLFTSRYGYLTWPNSHAAVRAGLAVLQFLRVRPFEQGNGEVSRLLLSLFLEDGGVPELPLDLVLLRRSTEYRDMARRAVLDGSAAGFIRLLVELCQEALADGQAIALEVQAETLRLRHAIAGMATGPVDTNHLAVALCSRLIVEDHQVIFACDADPQAAIALAHRLAAAGVIDEVEVDGKFFWSVPGIRQLICRGAARRLI